MTWVILGLVFIPVFSYGIYPMLMFLFSRFNHSTRSDTTCPQLSIIIPAYNEAGIIHEKINNTLALTYPEGKLQIILISDGSSDGIESLDFPRQISHLHQPERKGKAAALNRAMQHASGEWVLITDANAMVNPDALQAMVPHFNVARNGGVSGEKRVTRNPGSGSTASEGLYWKYESMVKKWEARFYSLTGAAGELFAFRRNGFTPLPENTVLDDLYISLGILAKGYKIAYEPGAWAQESASPGVKEEFARKVRIASGSLQVVSLLKNCSHPLVWMQFVAHRIFRWFFITPALAGLLLLTPWAWKMGGVFLGLAAAQWLFYAVALFGWALSSRSVRIPGFYIPFYFCMMHLAQPVGVWRAIRGRESALWEKISR